MLFRSECDNPNLFVYTFTGAFGIIFNDYCYSQDTTITDAYPVNLSAQWQIINTLLETTEADLVNIPLSTSDTLLIFTVHTQKSFFSFGPLGSPRYFNGLSYNRPWEIDPGIRPSGTLPPGSTYIYGMRGVEDYSTSPTLYKLFTSYYDPTIKIGRAHV